VLHPFGALVEGPDARVETRIPARWPVQAESGVYVCRPVTCPMRSGPAHRRAQGARCCRTGECSSRINSCLLRVARFNSLSLCAKLPTGATILTALSAMPESIGQGLIFV